MNTDLTSTADSQDLSTRPPLFEESVDDGEHWFTVTLDGLIADWGEGQTKAEAIENMADSLFMLHEDLHGEPDARLAEHLQYQRDFLCGLARRFGKHER